MRKIASQLRGFWQEDYHWATYLGTALLLTVVLVLNYGFGLADRWLYTGERDGWQLLRYIALFGGPYCCVLGLQALVGRSGDGIGDWRLWLAITLAILVVCVTAWAPWHKAIAKDIWAPAHQKWGILLLWNLKRLPLTVLPLLLYWLVMERDRRGLYGLWGGTFTAKPYLLMLLIVLPGVVAVSFLPDFLATYPLYKPRTGESGAVLEWKVAAFELSYGFTFVVVEWVFRGFMVIGLVRWLGPRAILPMVAMYCCIHLGKPMGEAIASIFGGYILGVVALKNRNVWGGIMIHLGIAWLMELLAWLQREY